jgi:hypothetical protein
MSLRTTLRMVRSGALKTVRHSRTVLAINASFLSCIVTHSIRCCICHHILRNISSSGLICVLKIYTSGLSARSPLFYSHYSGLECPVSSVSLLIKPKSSLKVKRLTSRKQGYSKFFQTSSERPLCNVDFDSIRRIES